MSAARLAFIVTTEDMVEIGQDNKVYSLFAYEDYLARITAKRIIECLPPFGWVRLHDATIDRAPCYAFMMGKRNTPPERVSPIMIEQLRGLFGEEPEVFVRGEEKDCWFCSDRKLVLEDVIL
ncbi:hypothetical protein FRC08_009855 [Ceratobasidium sp. 394]|nr:hypothetical protein FRC08_009855 [Ceratobasidium sp. 394]